MATRLRSTNCVPKTTTCSVLSNQRSRVGSSANAISEIGLAASVYLMLFISSYKAKLLHTYIWDEVGF